MAFEAILTVEDKSFRVISFNYHSGRDYDRFGRPTSMLSGFKIDLIVEHSSDCVMLHDWAYKNHEVKSGRITFSKRDNAQKQTEIRFNDGYIVDIGTSFNNTGDMPMVDQFTICAGSFEYESLGKLTSYNLDWPENN